MQDLVRLSLNHPVRVFVDSNTDTASNLSQEFVRIKSKKEDEREAILAGSSPFHLHSSSLPSLPHLTKLKYIHDAIHVPSSSVLSDFH